MPHPYRTLQCGIGCSGKKGKDSPIKTLKFKEAYQSSNPFSLSLHHEKNIAVCFALYLVDPLCPSPTVSAQKRGGHGFRTLGAWGGYPLFPIPAHPIFNGPQM